MGHWWVVDGSLVGLWWVIGGSMMGHWWVFDGSLDFSQVHLSQKTP